MASCYSSGEPLDDCLPDRVCAPVDRGLLKKIEKIYVLETDTKKSQFKSTLAILRFFTLKLNLKSLYSKILNSGLKNIELGSFDFLAQFLRHRSVCREDSR